MENAKDETKKRRASEQVNSIDAKRFKVEEDDDDDESSSEQMPEKERWQAHQLAEDYMALVSRIMGTDTSRTPSQQPHQVMARTPAVTSILELWNPREIALFEAAIYLHGKQFHKVQPFIKTKTTKQVVAFYYVWKKTLHYQEWKRQYTSSDSSSDSEQENT